MNSPKVKKAKPPKGNIQAEAWKAYAFAWKKYALSPYGSIEKDAAGRDIPVCALVLALMGEKL